MLKEIIIAFQAYYKAHQFIKKYKLWKWILVPGILYALLFMVSMYYFGHTCNNFIEWLSLETGLKTWLDKMNNGFLGFLFTLGSLMIWLIMMLFYFSLFKYIFLVIGSPIFSFLSEKTEAIMEGVIYPFSPLQLVKDIFRGTRIASRNVVWQSVYELSIFIVSPIPIAGWLTPFMAVLIECYYYGFSMLDYSMERNHKSTSESIAFIGRHKGLAIGNGMVFYAMHLIPVVGWVLAPTYSVVAATISLIAVRDEGIESAVVKE
ncbi:EI24 domain-containing protein [Parasediminibacterium sp. JCM 36343]|uniref:EI24 domain-containing protein n=1 Tax=Parasediminibacterium sp. JCM 36343 TaxID=3374279 RepID=UPI00397CBA39